MKRAPARCLPTASTQVVAPSRCIHARQPLVLDFMLHTAARDSTMRSLSKRLAGKWLLAVAAATVTAGAGISNASALEHVEGLAYGADGDAVLYRESHWLYQEDGKDARVVLYRCPDGTPFARKRLLGSPGSQVPDLDLEDGRSGYAEAVRSVEGRRVVSVRRSSTSTERSADLPAASDLVVDAGFDAFVRDHWDALAGPEGMTLSFLVPSRLAAMRFEVRRLADETIDERKVARFRLGLAKWYGGVLPHIDVLYDARTRVLRRYVGIANIRDGSGRNVDVRIEFPPGRRDSIATAADVDAALRAPLTGACPLA